MRVELDRDDRQLLAELLRERREDIASGDVTGFGEPAEDRLARIDSLISRMGNDA
jgi:hypothetical protein